MERGQAMGKKLGLPVAGQLNRPEPQSQPTGLDTDGRVRATNAAFDSASTPTEAAVLDACRTVYDPEIPVNIVELGLVYRCDIHLNDDGTRMVEIDMTLTAPGCGMGDIIAYDVREKVRQVPTVEEVKVEVVFDPPWSFEMMSEAAKLQTGMM